MSSRAEKEKACSEPLKNENRPYDNRPSSGPGRTARRTSSNASAVRVVLPDESPALTPEVARVLLRIVIKARDRLADTDNPHGGAE